MAYTRKTRDEWEVQGFYSGAWETETTVNTRKEALQRLKEYIDNVQGGVFRVKPVRVKI